MKYDIVKIDRGCCRRVQTYFLLSLLFLSCAHLAVATLRLCSPGTRSFSLTSHRFAHLIPTDIHWGIWALVHWGIGASGHWGIGVHVGSFPIDFTLHRTNTLFSSSPGPRQPHPAMRLDSCLAASGCTTFLLPFACRLPPSPSPCEVMLAMFHRHPQYVMPPEGPETSIMTGT